MPDVGLQQRFEAIVQGAAEPLARRYLEEAYRCFCAEAYNGAVVMAWNAVAFHLRRVVEEVGEAYFRHNYKILHGQEPSDDLRRINDNLFIQACARAGILQDAIPGLEPLRNRRNDCAHPTGIFVTLDEIIDLVESIGNIVSRQVVNERLTNIAILREFARVAGEQDGKTIAAWVQENLCPQLMHDLLAIFERDDEVRDVSGIIGLWRGLWNRVDDLTRQRLWDRIERIVRAVLHEADRSLRTPEEWVKLIVWPNPGDEHPSRDCVGQLFVEWIEQRAQSGEFAAADMGLAYDLLRHLPPSLCERLGAVLQEMVRRHTE